MNDTTIDTNALIERLEIWSEHFPDYDKLLWGDVDFAGLMTEAAEALRTLTAENERLGDAAGIDSLYECAHVLEAKVAALTRQLDQHQWHRVEDELPPSTEQAVIMYRPVGTAGNRQRTARANEVRAIINANPNSYTHWRYSTPPETTE